MGPGRDPGLFVDRGRTVTQCKPRGKPFRPRSIGRYLLGRHPIRSKVVVAPTVAA